MFPKQVNKRGSELGVIVQIRPKLTIPNLKTSMFSTEHTFITILDNFKNSKKQNENITDFRWMDWPKSLEP